MRRPSSSFRIGQTPIFRAAVSKFATSPGLASVRCRCQSVAVRSSALPVPKGNGQRALLRGLIGIGRSEGEVAVDGELLTHDQPVQCVVRWNQLPKWGSGCGVDLRSATSHGQPDRSVGRSEWPRGPRPAATDQSCLEQCGDQFGIVAASPFQPISALSGGNQQKIVLARPTLRTPEGLGRRRTDPRC